MEDNEERFETVPTFYPTLEEMRDFESYLVKLKEAGADEKGLTKIVPPKEWEWSPNIEAARSMRVRNPILQCVTGRSGIYSVCNVVKYDRRLDAYEQVAQTATGIPTDFSSNEALFEVERRFWKSLTTTAKPPLYGSDVEGTLFGSAPVAFNVNRLECLLKRCGVRVPGITNPMMYVGMWRSFFPFHTEDINMFSINVMHLGAPKFWYGIPPSETTRLENLGKGAWPEERCPEMMRHKTTMFSPTRLKQAGIPFVRGVQHPRDIMITWPSAFHGGFNAGFNIAEAVNFVPESLFDLWMLRARQAGVCKCRPDSVRLDLDWLTSRIEALKEKKAQHLDDATRNLNGDESPQEWFTTMSSVVVPVKSPRKEKMRSAPLDVKVGQLVDVSIEQANGSSVWVPVTVVAILEGSARLHQKNTSKSSDIWLPLKSSKLRLRREDSYPAQIDLSEKPPFADDDDAKRIKLELADSLERDEELLAHKQE